MNNINSFENSELLVDKLAKSIIDELDKSILKNGKATLLVSGGSTPKKLFEKLSSIDFPWQKITIALVDERWCETTSEDSNEFLVKEYLLKNKAIKANFVGMYHANETLYTSELINSSIYKKNLFPFDVVILGMGLDAHTASLFPDNEKLELAFDDSYENYIISIKPQTAPFERLSMTLKAILEANKIFLHFEGEEKLLVFNEALNCTDKYKMPISALLNQEQKDIEVYYS